MNIDVKNISKSVLITLLTFLLIATVQFLITFLRIDQAQSYSISYENFNFFINSKKVSTILSLNLVPLFIVMVLVVYYYNLKKVKNK